MDTVTTVTSAAASEAALIGAEQPPPLPGNRPWPSKGISGPAPPLLPLLRLKCDLAGPTLTRRDALPGLQTPHCPSCLHVLPMCHLSLDGEETHRTRPGAAHPVLGVGHSQGNAWRSLCFWRTVGVPVWRPEDVWSGHQDSQCDVLSLVRFRMSQLPSLAWIWATFKAGSACPCRRP